MVEQKSPKLLMWVRFLLLLPENKNKGGIYLHLIFFIISNYENVFSIVSYHFLSKKNCLNSFVS